MASEEKQPSPYPSPFARGEAKTGAKQYKRRAGLYPDCHLRGPYAHRPSVLTAAVKSIV